MSQLKNQRLNNKRPEVTQQVTATELEIAPKHALVTTAPRSDFPRSSRPSHLLSWDSSQYWGMALSSPQARRLPQARERGPAGRSRPQVVELPRPATSRHAGGPNRLRAAIPNSTHGPLSFARWAPLGKAKGARCRTGPVPHLLQPPTPAQRAWGRKVRQPHLSQKGDLSSDWRSAFPTRAWWEGGA